MAADGAAPLRSGRLVATIADTAELHLTSPAMDGPHVRRAQRALLHNAYGTFDPGPLDGVYGERTAAAVRRAKYWMGFPEQRIDQVCGSDLLILLAEQSPLPSSLKSMRTRRLKRAEDAQLWGGGVRRGGIVRRRSGGAAGKPPVRLH